MTRHETVIKEVLQKVSALQTQVHILSGFVVAALVGREVSALPEQRDASRPHHQVSASPAQEEEAAQHQRTVPGPCRRRPLLENQ